MTPRLTGLILNIQPGSNDVPFVASEVSHIWWHLFIQLSPSSVNVCVVVQLIEFILILKSNESSLNNGLILILLDEGKQYVLDTTILDSLDPLDTYQFLGVKAYFTNPTYELIRIVIPSRNLVLTPKHEQWNIAKLFLMQGAHYLIKFAKHPYVHFPLDAVISITHAVFPDPTNPIRQFMKPHEEFVYTINDNVLNQPQSVLNEDKTCCCFRAQPCDRANIEKVIAYGASKYRRPIGTIPNPQFKEMYDTIYKFALIVIESYISPSALDSADE